MRCDPAPERGDRAFAHFIGAERRDQRQSAAFLLRAGARGLGRGRRPCATGAAPGARRLLLVRLQCGASERPRLARCFLAEALFRLLLGLELGLSARACGAPPRRPCALRRRRARCARSLSRLCRGCAPLPRRSCALPPPAAGRRPARARRACCSSSVRVRRTTPDGFGAGAASRRRLAAGAGVAPRAPLAAPRRARSTGRGRRPPRPSPCRAAHRRLTFSTTTALVRPWLKLWRTTPCSTPRAFSVSVLVEPTLSFFSPVFSVVSAIPISILNSRISGLRRYHQLAPRGFGRFAHRIRRRQADLPGPVRKQSSRAARARNASLSGPASRAACTTFDRPNAKSNCARGKAAITAISAASSRRLPRRMRACARRRARLRRACRSRDRLRSRASARSALPKPIATRPALWRWPARRARRCCEQPLGPLERDRGATRTSRLKLRAKPCAGSRVVERLPVRRDPDAAAGQPALEIGHDRAVRADDEPDHVGRPA